MTQTLYLEDSYLQECDATVVSVKDSKYIVLDQTIFYPKGGGQPWDTGKLLKDNEIFDVLAILLSVVLILLVFVLLSKSIMCYHTFDNSYADVVLGINI